MTATWSPSAMRRTHKVLVAPVHGDWREKHLASFTRCSPMHLGAAVMGSDPALPSGLSF